VAGRGGGAGERAPPRAARHPGELNIVYVEGLDPDGTANDNRPNRFNDLRCVIGFDDSVSRPSAFFTRESRDPAAQPVTPGSRLGASAPAGTRVPKLLGKWEATTEPGRYWTEHPMNPNGAARIAFGQYTAWQVGYHHNDPTQEARVRSGGRVRVCRDGNRDYRRDGDARDAGFFGINQHHGYDLPKDDLGRSSAGCLVGRTIAGHRAFIQLVKSDVRYRADHRFVFTATVLPASAVLAAAAEGAGLNPAPTIATPRAKHLAVGAAIVAGIGAAAHWIDLHPLLTAGAVIGAALVALVVIDHLHNKGD